MTLPRCLLVGLLPVVFAACGGSGVEELPVVPAKGKATMGGVPLDGATLVFAALDGKYVATAIAEADGSFTLTTNNQAGAMPGSYKVIVTKYIFTEPKLESGEHVPTPGSSKLLTPEKYAKLDTTDLEATIPAEGSETLEVKIP